MMQPRREFLRQVAVGGTSIALCNAFDHFHGRMLAEESVPFAGFGPLREAIDAATGLPLIKLPEGFRYLSFGWTNEPMANGGKTPPIHDGMAVISEMGDQIVLCRNHEVDSPGRAFGRVDESYDPFGAGGCTNLVFDRRQEKFLSAKPSLSGTLKNCAGGATPWGTWLSCEETLLDPQSKLEEGNPLQKAHGFVFEVPGEGQAAPKPLEALGRFVHEAVAVDPSSGIVYLTEDTKTAGFYRVIPNKPGDLQAGGKLQMLVVRGVDDVRKKVARNAQYDVRWVDIADPLLAHTPGTLDGQGVYRQGKAKGGLTFARLEGCAVHDGRVFITATSGGDAESGQLWRYDPAEERLQLVYESPSPEILDMPDNIAVSPRGGVLMCEDGYYHLQRLQVLTAEGHLFPLAENNMQLNGLYGHRGDFRSSEWAGATFSADGQWLFVNLQTPGVTLAITGPWRDGLI
jgi:uncharacterized protein